jgi:hypothetical protein
MPMLKRQKKLEIKIVNFGAILPVEATGLAVASGYFKFLWELAFGVWDLSVSLFNACPTARPAAL